MRIHFSFSLVVDAGMMISCILSLLLVATGNGLDAFRVEEGSSETMCRYQDVIDYLNLNSSKDLFTMARPTHDRSEPTVVRLTMMLYAILDVREIDQTFISYVWIFTEWKNDFIGWNPADFCGIERIVIPTEALWKPDLTIEEMVEKDKAPPSPYLAVDNKGVVTVHNDQVVVSTCRIQTYKFPFDKQTCTITFKSVIHSSQELKLIDTFAKHGANGLTKMMLRTQFEWLFLDMKTKKYTHFDFFYQQDVIKYTITMERRSVLYIVNFLLPILFFLGLDMCSFLISDRGGEKLSFKVTVLLAVTVMQLILNEILPSTSDRIPLIAVYCIGIFGLMLLSLLETIVIMHLMDKDSIAKANKINKDLSMNEKKGAFCGCLSGLSTDETPNVLLKESSIQMTQPDSFESCSSEIKEVLKTLTLLVNSRKEDDEKPGYWTTMAKRINRFFFVFYVFAASVFLITMFSHWKDGSA